MNFWDPYFVAAAGPAPENYLLWDLPDNQHVQRIVAEMWGRGAVVGAVSHGASALINVMLDDESTSLVEGKELVSITTAEEAELLSAAGTKGGLNFTLKS